MKEESWWRVGSYRLEHNMASSIDDDGFFLAVGIDATAVTTTEWACGKIWGGAEEEEEEEDGFAAQGRRRRRRSSREARERKGVGNNGLRRACTMSLFLWLALECVLLGAAAGYRPLKDRALHFDNSLWLDEVLPVREHGILLLFALLYLFVHSVFRILRLFLHLLLFHSFLH
jgi:hypothetical protein